jgi:hypothetical protein
VAAAEAAFAATMTLRQQNSITLAQLLAQQTLQTSAAELRRHNQYMVQAWVINGAVVWNAAAAAAAAAAAVHCCRYSSAKLADADLYTAGAAIHDSTRCSLV